MRAEPTTSTSHLEQLRGVIDRDHERLLLRLEDVAALSRQGAHRSAAKVFGEFRILQEQRLERALECVARLEQLGGGSEPRARLAPVQQHLQEAIAGTWRCLSYGDRQSIDRALAALARAVGAHERAQKDELLPRLGARLADPELDHLIHWLVDD